MVLFQCAQCQRKLWKYAPLVEGTIRYCDKEHIAYTYPMESTDTEIKCICGNKVGDDVGEKLALLDGTYAYRETTATRLSNQAATLFERLPNRLATTLFVSGVCIGLFIYVILGEMTKDGSIGAAILVCIASLLILGPRPLRKWQANQRQRSTRQQREARVNRLLGNRTSTAMLKEAPFSYDRWPDGDNNYLVNDNRTGEIIHQITSPDEAELWILERFLAEQEGAAIPRGSYE